MTAVNLRFSSGGDDRLRAVATIVCFRKVLLHLSSSQVCIYTTTIRVSENTNTRVSYFPYFANDARRMCCVWIARKQHTYVGPYITVFVNQKDPAVCVHNTVLNRLFDRLNSTNAALVSGAEFSRKIVVTRVCVNDRVDRVCDHVNQFCRKFKISGTDFGSMDVLSIRAYTFREFPTRSKIIFRYHFPILEAADSDQVVVYQ